MIFDARLEKWKWRGDIQGRDGGGTGDAGRDGNHKLQTKLSAGLTITRKNGNSVDQVDLRGEDGRQGLLGGWERIKRPGPRADGQLQNSCWVRVGHCLLLKMAPE